MNLQPLGVGLALVAMVFVNKLSGLYDRDDLVLHRSTLDEIPKLLQISGLFALTTWLLHGAVTDGFLHQTDVLALWLVCFAALIAARILARHIAEHRTATERCLVIGDPLLAESIRSKMTDSGVNAEVVATLSAPMSVVNGDTAPFRRAVAEHGVDRVIVAPEGSVTAPTLEIVRMAKAAGLRVSLVPRLFEVVGSSVEFDDLAGLTMLGVRRFGLSRSSLAVKRSLDVIGAGLGLLAVSPVFAVIALAIRLDSRGSIFFRQTRVGRDGKRFQMIKFRSMVPDAEARKDALRHRNEADGLFKIADDPRITRVGRLLRATSLDELPQLLNVCRGEMSLVGPRPLVEEEDEMVLGFDRGRLHLTPGMTGHWQVLGSARIPMEEMVVIDYLYVANWSLWTDIKILLRTVAHVFARGGM
jgi:exopolysaccharide biosynthesis polyprenyl glycosylphosphotransferase